MTDEKRSAREAARSARRAVPEGARAAAGEAIARQVLALDGIEDVRTVLGYAATPDEADVSAALLALRERGARVAYPRVCEDGTLTIHWAEAGSLTPGSRGILEPAAGAPVAEPGAIDLALVPGTAFDAECCRLGQGGGCYDRALTRVPDHVPVVVLLFDDEVVDEVPAEPHDRPVDSAATPTRVVRFEAGGSR